MTVWKKDACCDGVPRITISVCFLMLAVTAALSRSSGSIEAICEPVAALEPRRGARTAGNFVLDGEVVGDLRRPYFSPFAFCLIS